MSKNPELGQIFFGNKTGDYGTEEFVDALVEALLEEIRRVFWNEKQREWDRDEDPKFKGLQFRPYDWSNNEKTTCLPNLKFDFSPQEIRWYKYPGRGQSCLIMWNEKQWRIWFDKAMGVIRSNEKPLY